MSGKTLRQQLEDLEFVCATGDLTFQRLYDTLFLGNSASVNADARLQSRGSDPLAWGIFPENSWVYMTDDWGQKLLLRYPDGTWHWHDSGAHREDGRVPAADDSGADVHRALQDLLSEIEAAFPRAAIGGFVDPALYAKVAPEPVES